MKKCILLLLSIFIFLSLVEGNKGEYTNTFVWLESKQYTLEAESILTQKGSKSLASNYYLMVNYPKRG